MSKLQIDLVRSRFQYLRIAIIVGVCLLILSNPSFADDAALPAGHGYLLIHVQSNPRERVAKLFMAKVESDEVMQMEMADFLSDGPNGWMAVVQIPEGRYYWNLFEPFYGRGVSEARSINPFYRRNAPRSADDTFEIVAGAINYVGDWRMHVITTGRPKFEPEITYEVSTLERFAIENPELANQHKIYLAMMGKEAISLEELAKILEAENDGS